MLDLCICLRKEAHCYCVVREVVAEAAAVVAVPSTGFGLWQIELCLNLTPEIWINQIYVSPLVLCLPLLTWYDIATRCDTETCVSRTKQTPDTRNT